MKRILQLFLLAILLGTVAVLMPTTVTAAQSAIQYERFDVNIAILADGRFTVQEIQQISFGGEFTTGFAEIPLAYTSGIEDVSVTGGPSLEEQTIYAPGSGAPETFTQSREGDTLFVDWEFAPTSPGDTLVFVLEYTVEGGLWIYPEAARLEWRAIPADRSGLPVPQSRVTVTLPATVAADQLTIEASGPTYTTEIVDSSSLTTIRYTANEVLADEIAFQVLLDFPRELVTAARQPWQVAADEAVLAYRIDQMDLEIEMQPDGTLYVRETQQVSVQEGLLYSGFRHFNLLFTDGIEILGVSEGELSLAQANVGVACEDCYTVETDPPLTWWASYSPVNDEVQISEDVAGEVILNWVVPPLVAGESTQFTLEYLVVGAVRPRETDQQLTWTAVSNYDVPVDNVTMRWYLPNGLGLEDVQFLGGEVSRAADGAVLITNKAPIPAEASWQIELTLPPDGTSATVPIWQEKIEAEVAEGIAYQERQARIDLAWLVGKILLGVTAVLGGLTYWYVRGSRRLREALGNYRTEPPSDLPPGVVNYLAEGKITARGILASVLHLADLGLVKLHMAEPLTVTAVRQEPLPAFGKLLTPVGNDIVVSRFLSQLFNHLLLHLPPGTAVSLPALLQTLPAQLPQLTKTMAEEMVVHFYGENGWRAKYGQRIIVGSLFLIFGVMVFVMFSGLAYRWSLPMPVFVFGGLLTWAFIAYRFSGGARSLTVQAKQEATKWQGFKAYLADINQYGDLAEAQEILDTYFAYAVALGVDDRLLAQIKQLGGYLPGWLQSGDVVAVPPVRPRSWQARWRRQLGRGSWLPRSPRPNPTGSLPSVKELPTVGNGRPSLETFSDGLASGLERASTGLAQLLNTAVGQNKEGNGPDIVLRTMGQTVPLNWDDDQTLNGMMSDIMGKAQTIRPPRPAAGGGRGGYHGGSRSSLGGGRSSSSRSRSSSSRRSGGGGRRGFG